MIAYDVNDAPRQQLFPPERARRAAGPDTAVKSRTRPRDAKEYIHSHDEHGSTNRIGQRTYVRTYVRAGAMKYRRLVGFRAARSRTWSRSGINWAREQRRYARIQQVSRGSRLFHRLFFPFCSHFKDSMVSVANVPQSSTSEKSAYEQLPRTRAHTRARLSRRRPPGSSSSPLGRRVESPTNLPPASLRP